MSRRVPETPSLVRLERRANVLRRLGEAAWDELPGGVLRVNLNSPQFGLCGFRDDLIALAKREDYEVTEAGPLVDVFRGTEWTKVREFLMLTPTAAELPAHEAALAER